MLDLQFICENVAQVAENCRNRGVTVKDGATAIARPLETRFTRSGRGRYDGAYPGTFPFVGSPDDVADDMAAMSATGLAGCTVAFVDYLREIPYFVQEVLPRLERRGLRVPVTG